MPLFWLSIAFIAGIIVADIADIPTGIWLACAAACLLFALLVQLLRRRAGPLKPMLTRSGAITPLPLVCLSFLALGAAYFQLRLPAIQPGFIAWYNNLQTPFVVEGLIVEPPDVRDGYSLLRVRTQQLHLKNTPNPLFQPVHGDLLARVPPDSDWRYGDQIRLEGQIETPPSNEEFSYQAYLARQGIYSYMSQVTPYLLLHGQGNPILASIYALKARAHAAIYAIYPDPEASLLAGILLGVESGIPQEVKDAFTVTGTSHLIAISGFNIAIIAGIFAQIFGGLLGPRRGTLAAILGVILYTALVGSAASVVRAAIMGCMGLFGRMWGRRQVAVNTLLITAAIMCLFNPHTPWDIGFQLSFAATLGLVLYTTPLSERLSQQLEKRFSRSTARQLTKTLSDIFLLTLAAQFLTLPLIIYHFGRVSLSALIVNPLVLPVQPALMILGGISAILGAIWLPLGKLIGWLAWPLVAYTIRMIEWMAKIPGGNLNLGDVALPLIILVYVGILISTVSGPLALKIRPLIKSSAVLGLLVLLTVFTWRAALSAPDGRLHVTVLNVGLGDAILIQTPSGRNVLVDGGPSLSRLSQSLGRRLPPSNRTLDWLVVANPGDEYLTAIPRLLDRFPVANVLWAGATHGTRSARDLQAAILQQNIPHVSAEAGHNLDLGDGARLEVLTVGPRGSILLLVWHRFRLMIPSGADFEALESLHMGADAGPVSALLLADGGYIASNPPEWIANLRPQAILLSVSPDDRSEHPSPETQEAIRGYSVLRTDQNGWIEVMSDGAQMWLTVERK